MISEKLAPYFHNFDIIDRVLIPVQGVPKFAFLRSSDELNELKNKNPKIRSINITVL